jgi:hypothetical protein
VLNCRAASAGRFALLYASVQDPLVLVCAVFLNRSAHNRLSHSALNQVSGCTPKTSGATAFQSHITGSEHSSAPARARRSERTIPIRVATIRFTAREPCYAPGAVAGSVWTLRSSRRAFRLSVRDIDPEAASRTSAESDFPQPFSQSKRGVCSST